MGWIRLVPQAWPMALASDGAQMPDAGVLVGHAGRLAQIETFNEAFTNLAYELLESMDGGENVVSVVHPSGAGDFELEQPGGANASSL
jgi:hypothetical protein